MPTILDGKILSKKILEKLNKEINNFTKKPKLAVILVGDDTASQIYVKNKKNTAEKIGIESLIIPMNENISEETLLEHIRILNEDENINGILIQLPLPKHINIFKVIETIEPTKDVDGFHPLNTGRLLIGTTPYAYPCTPKGIIRILKEYEAPIEGKNTVIIGRSNIVGKPAAQMFLRENATVTMTHSKTNGLIEILQHADIIVSAIGKPEFITENMVKKGVTIIDVGITRTVNGIKGDVDFDDVKEKCDFITPVPGGIGLMTVAMLMENTVELYKLQNQSEL